MCLPSAVLADAYLAKPSDNAAISDEHYTHLRLRRASRMCLNSARSAFRHHNGFAFKTDEETLKFLQNQSLS